jgi:hypothetical protein
VYLGHQGSVCDVRTDVAGCGQAYVLRLLVGPIVFLALEASLWRALGVKLSGKGNLFQVANLTWKVK